MSSTRNMYSQILVPFANATLAADANIAAFIGSGTVGELYVYDADTNLTVGDISASLAAGFLPRAIRWAVKYTDEDGNNAIKHSDEIPLSCIRSVRYEAGSDGTPKQVKIDAVGNIDCETEYCLKIRYESPEIAQMYGYQDLVKTYSYVTRCCADSCGCPDGAVWDALYGLAEQVNADPDSGMNKAAEKTVNYVAVRNTTASIDANDLDVAATFTKGSTTVDLASADTGYQANAATLAVGDQMKVAVAADGDLSGMNVSTGAYDMFRVESVGTDSFVLDRPWPYATVTHAGAANTGVAVIPKATVEAYADSTWLAMIVGADQVNPVGGGTNYNYFPAYVTDFHVGLSCGLDCNATVTTSTELVQPEGYGADIQKMEIDLARHGNPYQGATLTNQPKAGYDFFVGQGTTQVTANFNQLIVEYTDCGHESAEQPIISRKKLIIAVDAGDTTLLGATAADASGDTDDDLLSFWARLSDLAPFGFEMEQLDIDAGTD